MRNNDKWRRLKLSTNKTKPIILFIFMCIILIIFVRNNAVKIGMITLVVSIACTAIHSKRKRKLSSLLMEYIESNNLFQHNLEYKKTVWVIKR